MLERVWRKGNPLTLLVGMQTNAAAMESSVEFLKKLETELPYDPAIPFLGIHTKETRSERDTCTPMFIAALFIIARTWASRLLPCPGYYTQCCNEHWSTRVSFNSGFLSVYAQQWDCWVLRQFYFQFFKEYPQCSP